MSKEFDIGRWIITAVIILCAVTAYVFTDILGLIIYLAVASVAYAYCQCHRW